VRSWGLALALLLSLGVNIGILATLAVRQAAPPDRPDRPRPAEPRPTPPRPGPGEETAEEPPLRANRLADRLGLEGEQRRRFLRIQGRFFAETVRLRTEQAEVFRELRRELSAPEPDRQKIEELTRASARAHLGLQQAMVRNVTATREILDPDQQRLFLDIISRLGPPPGLGGKPQRPRRPFFAPRRR
jgi:Spy/CpxP family protein refolding chaperone